jgi:hypothetical protein
VKITIFNTSEQSSAFNHEYGSWASEPKARTPTVVINARLLMRVESVFFHYHKISIFLSLFEF